MRVERLSTSYTFYIKFIFPFLLFGAGSIHFYLAKNILERAIYGLYFLYRLKNIFIKKVYFSGSHFVVSNFIREVSIPASHLKDFVEVEGFENTVFILCFEVPTDFGKTVKFISIRESDVVFARLDGCLRENKRGSKHAGHRS